MATKDMLNNMHTVPLFYPAAATTDNTAYVSQIIDTYGYEAVTLVMVTGTETDADATFTALLEDGNNSGLSDNATVSANQTVGTAALASFTFAGDNVSRKIGYTGDKRYVRLTVTPANNTGNVFLAGVAILERPRNAPTANPPQ